MQAVFKYGNFKMIMKVNEPLRVIAIPKPVAIQMVRPELSREVDLSPSKLLFELRKSPRPGEVLEYEFVGEQ